MPYNRALIPFELKLPQKGNEPKGLYNTATGKIYPLQWINKDTAIFILTDTLTAGKNMVCTVKKVRQLKDQVRIKNDNKDVFVSIHNKPVFTYHIKEVLPPPDSPAYYKRSGFIHPLYTPGGQILTDDFPSNHAHQHAVFHAWTNTTYKGKHVDFWNQHQKTGTVKNASVLRITEGPVFSELVTRQEYESLEFGTVLAETWTIRIYNLSQQFIFDLSISQENISADTLFLEKYIYGGMAFRGSKQWDKFNKNAFRQNWSLVTSEGLKDSAANHTAAKWVMVTGDINGQPSTATVFNHPYNFRYPQKIRVHPEMPYWVYSPVVDMPFNIPPKGIYTAKYRYFLTNFPPTPEVIKAVSDGW